MRFNKNTKDRFVTTNHEDEKAYSLDAETELYSLVCTAIMQNKFYESNESQLNRIRELIKQVNPKYVAKLAIYAREQMNLRSVPIVLAVELAKIHKGDKLVSELIERVVQRADEITELLAYYQFANKRKGTKKLNKLSKQLQKGLGKAFNKFDEYQFSKYNRKTEVTLKDALFLTHPKAKDDLQQELFNKIVNDKLEVPYTWEVELSKGEDKKATWETLIASKKVGYMALLRNLRNILNANISKEYLAQVCTYLSDKEAVAKSKQLPFRFLAAYHMLRDNDSVYTSMVLDALEEAVLHSTENIKGYDYNTSVCIACDVSGSMENSISDRSKIQYYDIGLMLGMLMHQKCKAVTTGIFGDTWAIEQLPKNAVLNNVVRLHEIEGKVGYSTNGYKVIEYLIQNNIVMDKIMMFTDCQLWNSHYSNKHIQEIWNNYKNTIAPNAKLYLFNLAGYGTTPVNTMDSDVYLISGWSDKVFDMLDAIENKSSVIDKINTIEL